jgi:hypothetical protein
MPNSIEIDDEVFGFLQGKAKPFVDTPNSVLRRLLGFDSTADQGAAPEDSPSPQLDESTHPDLKAGPIPTAGGRAPRGSILPEEAYWLPALRYLIEVGGEAPTREVVDAVGKEFDAQGRLSEVDKQQLRSGGIRWRTRAEFTRPHLVPRGYLDGDAPHGIWRITEQGRRYVLEARS